MLMADKWAGVVSAIDGAERLIGAVGVSVVSPEGDRFAHNGTRPFVAASTVKIAVMIELFRQVDAGLLTLESVHTVSPNEKADGSGVIAHLHDGIGYTLADLAYLMMSISDNTATNVLIDLVGMARVNATLRDLGAHGSTLGRKMRGQRVAEDEKENWAVPDEYAALIGALLENWPASPASCSRMLELLEAQQNDRRIARHLSRENRPRWGSKTGSLPGIINDVGYIMTDRGPLVLAVFCEGAMDAHAGEQIIGDIAKAALDSCK